MSGDNLGLGPTEPLGDGPPQPGGAGASRSRGDSLPLDEAFTQRLPPEYAQRPLPARIPTPPGQPRTNPLVVALTVVLVLAVIGGTLAYLVHRGGQTTTTPACGTSGACAAANSYLTAYTGFKFEEMYALTSQASRTRFSDANILNGAYPDAHTYIVSRTQKLLARAQITSIAASPAAAVANSDGSFTVPAHIVLTSSLLGAIAQDITIPVVNEGGKWLITWSPGLIFSQLDDPADPLYRRLVELLPETGARGTIFDRDGNALAQDGPVREIDAVPNKLTPATVGALAAILNIPTAQINATLAGKPGDQPTRVWVIADAQYAGVSATLGSLAGVTVQSPMPGRIYPYGQDTAAVTGYLGQVSADEIKNDPTHYYQSGDVIGRAGVEQWGEQYLRPVKGGKLEIDNANADGSPDEGAPVYTLADVPGANGADVHTTISLKLQQTAMSSLRTKDAKYAGGAFAVDPGTGEVLVMASNPTYNPSDFADSLNGIDPALHPQLNCAIQCTDPTGSIFKIVTLAAALQNGIKPTDIFTCTGHYQVPGEDHLRIDDLPTGHGSLTAPDALGPSCDVIFWNIAVILNAKDPNLLPSVGKAFGYGAPTGIIGVPNGEEGAGLVPDPQWLQQNKNAGWSPTDAANLGTGQGFFTATPAQVAMVSAALANNGTRMEPRLVSSVESASGTLIQSYAAKSLGTLPLSADNLAVMQVAMLGSTSTPTGTSYDTFHDLNLSIGGKTGTAESGQQHPHAWFTAYAPASPLSGPPVQAKIAIGALVEYSDYGDKNAAPVVKALLKAEFNL
jgi:penicillin-binding protein 2